MNNDFLKTLKDLKQIAPDAGYSARARHMLMAEIGRPAAFQRKIAADVLTGIFSRKFTFAAITAITVVLIVSGSALFINSEMDKRSFVAQANQVNDSIKVKLEEIKYILGSENIEYNKGVIIQTMLGEAMKNLEEASKETNTEKSIEKIKSAQVIFSQIDLLLKK